jgi:hypothetical protein
MLVGKRKRLRPVIRMDQYIDIAKKTVGGRFRIQRKAPNGPLSA